MFPSLFSSRKMKTISNQTITNQIDKNYINEMIPRKKKGREERRRENGVGSGTSNQPVVLRIVNTADRGRLEQSWLKRQLKRMGTKRKSNPGRIRSNLLTSNETVPVNRRGAANLRILYRETKGGGFNIAWEAKFGKERNRFVEIVIAREAIAAAIARR